MVCSLLSDSPSMCNFAYPFVNLKSLTLHFRIKVGHATYENFHSAENTVHSAENTVHSAENTVQSAENTVIMNNFMPDNASFHSLITFFPRSFFAFLAFSKM